MINWELISVILFYSILGITIYKNRKKMEVMDKVFFVYKWKKGAEYIRKISRPPWLWKILSTLAIPICLFFMLYSVQILYQGAVGIIQSPDPTPTVGLLIPGVQLPGSDFYVPFWYGIISIVVLAVVHEASHGIIATVEKIKIKTTGVGLFLFLPLAFVEPVINSFKKATRLSRIRMLCAGSFANLTTALIAFLIVVNLLTPLIDSEVNYSGVLVKQAVPNEPAALSGMPNNTKLISVNNKTVANITEFYYALMELTPEENVTIITSNGTYFLTTSTNPNNQSMAYLGVIVEQDWEFKQELKQSYPEFILWMPFVLTQLLMWVSNLNFAVGIFNLYPLWITDGGKIFADLLGIVIKDDKKAILLMNVVFFAALGLLLFNMIGPFFMI